MGAFTAMAHINSLNGEMREITVLDMRTVFGRPLENEFIVQYGKIKCTAIFNPFTNQFYADDKYGIITEGEKK